MPFFEENNRRFEKSLIVIGVLICIYFSSDALMRWSNTYYREVDGCPAKGCEVVRFPRGTTYLFFKPLVDGDLIVTHAEFEFYE